MRSLAATILALTLATPVGAQTYSAPKPRKQFVTFSIDWMHTETLHFSDHPLEDLVGRPVASTQNNDDFEYQTRDEQIQINVLEFRKRNRGLSLAVYPLGLSSGTTFGIRGSIEQVPTIRVDFEGSGAPPDYALTGATAYDIGGGLFVADRSAGWGLGSQAFIVGGIGRVRSDNQNGTRTFAEGGGGLIVGPFGVQLAIKFAWNRFEEPVEHTVLTVPITVRGTISF